MTLGNSQGFDNTESDNSFTTKMCNGARLNGHGEITHYYEKYYMVSLWISYLISCVTYVVMNIVMIVNN